MSELLIVSGAARVKKVGGSKITLQFDDVTNGKSPYITERQRFKERKIQEKEDTAPGPDLPIG